MPSLRVLKFLKHRWLFALSVAGLGIALTYLTAVWPNKSSSPKQLAVNLLERIDIRADKAKAQPVHASFWAASESSQALSSVAKQALQTVVSELTHGVRASSNKQADRDLLLAAKSLRAQDIDILANLAIDLQEQGDKRSAAVFLITHGSPQQVEPALVKLATQRSISAGAEPDSGLSWQKTFTVSTAVRALESLDRFAEQGHPEGASGVFQVLQSQPEPSIRRLAQISWRGIRAGHPGTLNRWLTRATGTDSTI